MIWPKDYRVRKRITFQEIQRQGSRKRASCFLALYLHGSESKSRIGITVSKKVGNAVVRNKVKRWIREGLRREYPRLTGIWDVVIIAYPSAAHAGAARLQADIRNVFLFLSRKSQ